MNGDFRKQLILTAIAVIAAGCPVAGVGRDIEKLGGKIEKNAEQKKN